MALSNGTKLGPYQIESALGAGGMGEVYRARDTRLERTVAIKLLNSALGASPDLKARFEREARTISQLNHPNICTLFDIGQQDGADYLVMELLEGESLADRLKRGPMPLPELIKIGCDIADALDRAHRAGIVHRDLKPGNVMLTKAGAKLLDFGLAKPAVLGAAAGSGSAPLLSAAMTSPNPQQSPLTQQGALVGTVQYMSPEQIQGAEADPRSDIFAFGAVLYEMATGKRPFQGKSQIGIASAILEKDPEPISPIETPDRLQRVITTCLAKDPEQRFSSAHDVKLELNWVALKASQPLQPQPDKASRRTILSAIAVAIGLAIVAAAITYWLTRPATPQVIEAVLPTPDKLVLDATGDFAGPEVISPDGSAIAFVGHAPGNVRALWVRKLSDGTSQHLEGTEGASFPFWSPDSRSIAFFANGKLNKVSATGGPVLAIADAPSPRGGSWGKGDVILFEPDFQSPLLRVSAQGGAATEATLIDAARHTTHRWPSFLPDGRHFLFLATNHNGGMHDQNGVYLGSLDSKESHLVVTSDSGAQYANGYLLFHSQTTLMAQPFDPSTGKLSGEARVVIDRVAHDAGVWRTLFSASNTGILSYQGGSADKGTELVWVDRGGKEMGRIGEHAHYSSIRFSPDGRRLAAAVGDPKGDIWTYDLARGTSTRLTFEPGAVDNPAWSPDGNTIFYNVFPSSNGSNTTISSSSAMIFMKRADGVGASKMVVQEDAVAPGLRVRPAAMSPQVHADGKTLLYIRRAGPIANTIAAVPIAGGKRVEVIAPASPQSNIIDFRLSSDGRWVAYTSNESGRPEVFIVPYPNATAGKWQVSSSGGQFPVWRGDSKELFFFGSDNRAYAVTFDGSGAQPQIASPQALFSIPNTAFNGFYEVMPDGKHFLLNRVPEQTSTPISLVINWPEVLKKN